jgi:hypothetical protein
MEKTLEDIGIGNYFLNRSPIAQKIRARINKLKSFCTSKENYQNQDTTHRMGENLHKLELH